MRRKSICMWLAVLVVTLFLAPAGVYAEDTVTHRVKPGETLRSIASKYGLSASALVRANGIANADLIRVGQQLVIPKPGQKSTTVTSQPAAQASRPSYYVVQRGQTLAQIARALRTSVSALVATNNISNPDRIYPGMQLRVPGAGAGPVSDKVTDTRFVASISLQHCWLYQNGTLIGDWTCSSGRRESPTAPGNYRVQSKIEKAYGSRWDFWMPYWLGLYYVGSTENGIHGLPYNPDTGRRTWEGLVGTPITFGCIMLEDTNAKLLFETAYIGMPVVILR